MMMKKVKGNPMTTATEITYITTREAATRANVSLITIHRWMRLGLFGFKHKDRRERLVLENEFERFRASLDLPTHHSTA